MFRVFSNLVRTDHQRSGQKAGSAPGLGGGLSLCTPDKLPGAADAAALTHIGSQALGHGSQSWFDFDVLK